MIFRKFPEKILISVDSEDELGEITVREDVPCEVILIDKKYIEDTAEGKEVYIVICHEEDGTVLEVYLNTVKLTESQINKDYGINTCAGKGAFTESRRRKKNRNRVVPAQRWENGNEKREGNQHRGTSERQADES